MIGKKSLEDGMRTGGRRTRMRSPATASQKNNMNWKESLKTISERVVGPHQLLLQLLAQQQVLLFHKLAQNLTNAVKSVEKSDAVRRTYTRHFQNLRLQGRNLIRF